MSKISLSAGLTDLHCLFFHDYRLALIRSRSFRCALIHCHRPDLIDYDKLDKVDHRLKWYFVPVNPS